MQFKTIIAAAIVAQAASVVLAHDEPTPCASTTPAVVNDVKSLPHNEEPAIAYTPLPEYDEVMSEEVEVLNVYNAVPTPAPSVFYPTFDDVKDVYTTPASSEVLPEVVDDDAVIVADLPPAYPTATTAAPVNDYKPTVLPTPAPTVYSDVLPTVDDVVAVSTTTTTPPPCKDDVAADDYVAPTKPPVYTDDVAADEVKDDYAVPTPAPTTTIPTYSEVKPAVKLPCDDDYDIPVIHKPTYEDKTTSAPVATTPTPTVPKYVGTVVADSIPAVNYLSAASSTMMTSTAVIGISLVILAMGF